MRKNPPAEIDRMPAGGDGECDFVGRKSAFRPDRQQDAFRRFFRR